LGGVREGEGGIMTQRLHAHMNKIKIKKFLKEEKNGDFCKGT
jgi:hypothetical protein